MCKMQTLISAMFFVCFILLLIELLFVVENIKFDQYHANYGFVQLHLNYFQFIAKYIIIMSGGLS